MRDLATFRRAILGLTLLLSACAGRGDAPEMAPAAGPQPLALAGDDLSVIDATSERLVLAAVDDEVPTVVMTEPVRLPLLDDRLAARAISSRPAGTQVGYLLLDVETGQTLAEYDADLPLIPASTAKLATAIVALDVLGPEHRFETELLTSGTIRGQVLDGDLILRGSGDPILDVADLLELVVRLEAIGIRRVDGRFLIDDTALPRLSEIEPTQPLEAAYNPGIGALSLSFNRVRVAYRGGRILEAATLPPLAEARFEAVAPALLPPTGAELKSAVDEAVVWRVADHGQGRREISLPVKDAGLHAGHVFRWLALAQGIELDHPTRSVTPFEARRLAVHESPPLRALVRDMLVYSNNMMAELIGLAAAKRLGNATFSLTDAGHLLVRHLGRLMPEVDWTHARLGNHSGLESGARLTPRQLAAVARYGWRNQALPALLPAGGWSGTLANRFDEPDAALRVWAKTGTVHYGSALAGYLFPDTGRPTVFVTMVSDTSARAVYDRRDRRDRAADAAARIWDARARALQDNLVESWLEPLFTS